MYVFLTEKLFEEANRVADRYPVVLIEIPYDPYSPKREY